MGDEAGTRQGPADPEPDPAAALDSVGMGSGCPQDRVPLGWGAPRMGYPGLPHGQPGWLQLCCACH